MAAARVSAACDFGPKEESRCVVGSWSGAPTCPNANLIVPPPIQMEARGKSSRLVPSGVHVGLTSWFTLGSPGRCRCRAVDTDLDGGNTQQAARSEARRRWRPTLTAVTRRRTARRVMGDRLQAKRHRDWKDSCHSPGQRRRDRPTGGGSPLGDGAFGLLAFDLMPVCCASLQACKPASLRACEACEVCGVREVKNLAARSPDGCS